MTLLAGVGRVTITPPADIPNGMWMAQTHVRAEGIHQDLWLTALALRDGPETVLILDLDWCLLSHAQAGSVREAVSAETGIPQHRILPCCTHSHAGPVTQEDYRGEGAEQVANYIRKLPNWATQACVAALGDLRPARVAAGWGRSEIGVNRDLRLPDGRVVAGPNPDGPADQSVCVVRLENGDGSPLAILVNYACHPTVLGPDNRLVSPDYPGATKRVVEELTGATCLFLQGAAGDMGPVEGFQGDPAVAERLGTLLGLEATKVALSLDARPVRQRLARVIPSGAPLAFYEEVPLPERPARLQIRSGTARLPVRSPLPEIFSGAPQRLRAWTDTLAERRRTGADATAIAEANQNLERERLRASRHAIYAASEHLDVELHALLVGHVAFVFAWGEPYSQIGIEVKRRSPIVNTLFCGYVGGDPTYVATPEAYSHPQPFQLENCPFAPEAADVMIQASLDLLSDVGGGPSA